MSKGPNSQALPAALSSSLGSKLLTCGGWALPPGVALAFMLLLAPHAVAVPCVADVDCADGVFCNGIERCAPAWEGANARGCVSGTPPCAAGQGCDEDSDRCFTCPNANPDVDGDGHRSLRCGGDDCDDRDASRYPGRMEVCDLQAHDEDCDPSTFGHRDDDGDGDVDGRCCNTDAGGTLRCGNDYMDANPSVRLGAMTCDGPDAVVVFGASSIASFKCPSGTKCVMQPNATGICIVPPADYAVPERFVPPPLPAQREALPSLGALQASMVGWVRQDGVEAQISTAEQGFAASSVAVAPAGPGASTSGGDPAAQVAECRKILESGTVSWGGGTSWESGNIEKLCDGTQHAKDTIACFQSNVAALGWATAIERCKASR